MTQEPLNPTPTEYDCYGKVRPITLSWSRLNDWAKCRQRVKLTYEGKKTKKVNARNFLAGNLADYSMRDALTNAERDEEGRLLSLSLEELLDPLPARWESTVNNPEKNRVYEWRGPDPREDQKKILLSAQNTLRKLHPILEKNVIGHRYIPELRPPTNGMPIFGIPGPDGEPCYIRLFLAVDCAVQVEEDPEDINKGWGLFDLKTTEHVEYINQTLPQLVFYDLAFHALTGQRPIQHGLWAPLLTNPEIKVEVTDQHRMMITNWIVNYCHSVWAGEDDFTSDDSNCYNCPTRAACPKVVQPLTKDEQGLTRIHFR